MKNRILAGILAFLLFLSPQSVGGLEFTDGETTEYEACTEPAAEPVMEPQSMKQQPIDTLSLLDEETAGAAMEEAEAPAFFAEPFGISISPWSFRAYYVNQDDPYFTEKSRDFNLKYQYEFHTDMELGAHTVEIRFPQVLLTDRFGTEILPSDIGVPFGTPEEGGSTFLSNSPFNYYVEGGELVFFNYREIRAGTNAAVQVLYKNLKALDLVDNSAWSLTPCISVITGNGREERQTESLCGVIDTEAELSSLSKSPLKEPELHYTPGLYTKEQVKRYLPELPAEYEERFSDYAYVLWKIKITGNATQAWELYLQDTPDFTYGNAAYTGTVAGMQIRILNANGLLLKTRPGSPVSEGPYAGFYRISDYLQDFRNRTDISLEAYIVTAYPKEFVVQNDTVFHNTVTCTLHPADGSDEDMTKNASADWSWADYRWIYSGDIIGVRKKTPRPDYAGWLDTYIQASKGGRDLGEFPFHTRGEARIYGYTHQTGGASLGQYIEGSYCTVTTADDVLYAYPQTGEQAGQKYLLDDRDYYFSKIAVQQKDRGYDIFEDKPASPEEVPTEFERGMTVYAMFAGSREWEEAGYVPWNPSGELTFDFTEELLARQPWRVKAVHNCVDYTTECSIDVSVTIKGSSPVFGSFCDSGNPGGRAELVRLENLCGIMGRACFESGYPFYFHDRSTAGELYQEEGLIALTKELYDTIVMRDCDLISLGSLEKHAQAGKYAAAFNDPEHERVRIQYTAAAFESYRIYSPDAADYLRKTGFLRPGRKEAVFYDLLPHGVQFDPSGAVTTGLLTGISETDMRSPAVWNKEGVSVIVDSERDIVPDFRNTGRTLVKFHVSYTGGDSSVFDDNFWLSGFGVSFSAFCDWKDIRLAEEKPNICAFMPETGDLTPLLGAADEIACDDGVIVPAFQAEDYRDFGKDINDDGITDIPNVLYCRAMAFEDIAVASQSGIIKTVRADEDRFGIFDRQAVVGAGDGYTYDLTVTNTSMQPLTDIVLFDRLECAAKERGEEEPDMEFEKVWWNGTFKKAVLSMAKELGIRPVLYYHRDRNTAPLPRGGENPHLILTPENGWYPAKQWTEPAENVQAIAADLSVREDGTPFVLGNMESLSLRIRMQAPKESPDARYAYNHPAFSSLTLGVTEEENVRSMVYGDSVKVRLETRQLLEVQKALASEPPSFAADEEFLFTVSVKQENGKALPYASREYSLYRMEGGNWQKQNGVFATDAGGRFWLKNGEKAVFRETAGVSMLKVSEEAHPFWKQERKETLTDDSRQLLFTNRYCPVLYLQKKLSACPKETDFSETAFRVQLLCGGKPASGQEFWYVDKAGSYGMVPKKLGEGVTDENGIFSIRAGEILALFPGEPGDAYEVTELSDSFGEGTDWLGEKTSAKGTLGKKGNSETLENLYRWKDLFLLKKIAGKEDGECTEEFTFELKDAEGRALAGKEWELLDKDRQPLTPPVKGRTGEDGRLRCACGDKIIKIRRLEAGETVTIQEVDVPCAYLAENNGLKEVTLPLYSTGAQTELQNEYRMRNLKVSKLVLPSEETEEAPTDSPSDTLFEMCLLLEADGKFSPVKDFPYTVRKGNEVVRNGKTDEQGHFRIAGMETAEFAELGTEGTGYRILETPDTAFPPVYPAAGVPAEGTLQKNTEPVLMLNGEPGSLAIRKEYRLAEGETQKLLRPEELSGNPLFSTKFQIELDTGDGFVFPDGTALLIDTKTGETSRAAFSKEKPLELTGGQTAVLSGLSKNTKYRITELKEYRHRTVKYKEQYLAVHQSVPPKDGSATGTVGVGAAAVILNEVQVFSTENRIYKRMTRTSDFPPDGSELFLRVERYNGSGWTPAGDVGYLILDPYGNAGISRKTAGDGLLSLVVSEEAIPSVLFAQKVYVRPKDVPDTGDLRIVELLEQSSPDFGFLTGYASSRYFIFGSSYGGPSSYDAPPELADILVNSNVLKPLEVEKKLNGAKTEQDFLMSIQALPGIGFSGKETGRLSYGVYDSLTEKKLYDARTSADGEFTLKAGQFARFYLGEGSAWNLTEKLPYPYRLEKTDAENGRLEVRSDQSVTVYLDRSEILGLLSKDMVDFGVYDVETGEKLNLTKGKVVLPQKILHEGGVVRIAGLWTSTFEGCPELTEIVLPDGITSIRDSAFSACHRLTDIKIPDSVTFLGNFVFERNASLEHITLPSSLSSLGYCLFQFCPKLKEIEIPSGVQSIGSRIFCGCTGLKRVLIPETVTDIGQEAFSDCKSLEEIKLPDAVSQIDYGTFMNCESLKEITLPKNAVYIDRNAFLNCRRLQRVSIPEGMGEIDENAFSGCSSLKKIELPGTVRSIAKNAFEGCQRLEGIYVDGPKDSIPYAPWGAECPVYWKGETGGDQPAPKPWDWEDEQFYYIEKNGGYCVSGCKDRQTEAVEIPESVNGKTVTGVGDYAFSCMDALTAVSIPDTVTALKTGCFDGCRSLARILIPDTVVSVGDYAFRETALREIALPKGLKSVGTGVFKNCEQLEAVVLPDSLSTLGTSMFEGCTALSEIPIPETVEKIGDYAFFNCGSLKKMLLSDRITVIGEYAFSGCSALEEVRLPKGLTLLSYNIFSGCRRLRSVTLPEGLTKIDKFAFEECNSLESIRLPGQLTEIGDYAFRTTLLEKIVIPSTVTKIGYGCFEKCRKLTLISIKKEPKSINSAPWNAPNQALIIRWEGEEKGKEETGA